MPQGEPENRISLETLMPLLASGALVATLSGVLYFVGLIYAAAFAYRLSLPISYLALGSTFFMSSAILPAGIAALCLAPSVYLARRPSSRWFDPYVLNVPILLVATAFVLLFFSDPPGIYRIIALPLAVISVGLTVYLIKNKHEVSRWVYDGNIVERLTFLGVAVLLAGVLAFVVGSRDARQLVKGFDDIGTNVILHFADPGNVLEGRSLILAMSQGGYYYVIEREDPPSDFPRLYLVPSDKVLFVEVHRGEEPVSTPIT